MTEKFKGEEKGITINIWRGIMIRDVIVEDNVLYMITINQICNIFNEFNFIYPVIFYYYFHIILIYSSLIKETECPMTDFELLKLIILSKDKKHLIHLLNKYRISEQKSKYC